MTRELVFVHGRSQQHKDAVALKKEWLDALGEGLAKSSLTLPISDAQVRFPFYGDTLFDLSEGRTPEEAAEIIVRGDETDAAEKRFVLAGARGDPAEKRHHRGTNGRGGGPGSRRKGSAQLAVGTRDAAGDRRFVPDSSSSDDSPVHPRRVRLSHQHGDTAGHRGRHRPGDRHRASRPSSSRTRSERWSPTICFGARDTSRNWKVPLFVTVGSPLAVTAIRAKLKGFAPTRMPECAGAWLNAMDPRDVVALYPLDPQNFPIDPANPEIENKTDVSNKTENRHGISGYLDNEVVAARIHGALTK